MKLLIVTQVIDTEHPILGFFHRWVEELAKHCEQVQVICLQAGTYNLPPHVTVHSLGKEAGKGRLVYLVRFFKLIWVLRRQYDTVFVHMNQLYVILGAPVWRILGKRIGLWYAHGTVSSSLRLATFLTHIVFTSTSEGFRINTKKLVLVGQGIDTKQFVSGARSPSKTVHLITVGRISTSKNIDTLLQACALLKQRGQEFRFKIVGVATTESEKMYEHQVRKLTSELGLDEYVEWTGAISNRALPAVLQQSDIFIHDGSTNSLDKTLLEAALCGCIVVSSNPAYRSLTEAVLPELLFLPKDHVTLADKIVDTQNYKVKAEAVRTLIKTQYDISTLAQNIISTYSHEKYLR